MRSFTFISGTGLILLATVVVGAGSATGQTQDKRNPVLEFCTGTWCQWCPCADTTIYKSILPAMPNAIILSYHGAGDDPFRIFPGSTIISSLNFFGYPTGVIDRVSGAIIWGDPWVTAINNRSTLPPTVRIELTSRSYNAATRQFTASIKFTALQNLSGDFKYSIILVEDDVKWDQTSNNTCTPGKFTLPGFIHDWLVRDMMNGAFGETIVNGAWNQNQALNMSITHTVPIPPAPAPDLVPKNCHVVIKVYKNGAPLNSNAEIQQAGRWPLLTTKVEDSPAPEITNTFEIMPSYPNPLHLTGPNAQAQISYVLPARAEEHDVFLAIYNQLGQKVRTLVDGRQRVGSHNAVWDGRDDQNRPEVGGIYFYQLRFGANQATRKIVVLR